MALSSSPIAGTPARRRAGAFAPLALVGLGGLLLLHNLGFGWGVWDAARALWPLALVLLAPVLLVDGDKVTHAASDLANVTVTAEVLGNERGKKIVIQKFKNKTGYKKRQGHRQELTRVKITGIK